MHFIIFRIQYTSNIREETLEMDKAIFREYDIRGIVGKELILENAYQLGQAIIYFLKKENPELTHIALGIDGRTHSSAFAQDICSAITDSGINVLWCGMVPSPILYFATRTQKVQAGLMITASHNPAEYNGIKIVGVAGSVWGTNIKKIEKLFRLKKHIKSSIKGKKTGIDIAEQYLDYLENQFKDLKNSQLSMIVDCCNGATGPIMRKIKERFKLTNLTLLFDEVDGTYPNHEPDPTVVAHLHEMKKQLSSNNYSLGMGLDGDGDRFAAMTKEGLLLSGDQLLAIYVQQMIKQYPGMAVVFDIKSSQGLIELLDEWQLKGHMSPAGHPRIKQKMVESQALIAGELSGHYFFKDRYFGYDDGIYALMRLVELLAQTGKSLAALLTIFPHKLSSPEMRIACKDSIKIKVIYDIITLLSKRPDVTLNTLDGVRFTLPYGWALIRPSNTQPMLSIRYESDTKQGLKRIKEDLYQLLSLHINSTDLL